MKGSDLSDGMRVPLYLCKRFAPPSCRTAFHHRMRITMLRHFFSPLRYANALPNFIWVSDAHSIVQLCDRQQTLTKKKIGKKKELSELRKCMQFMQIHGDKWFGRLYYAQDARLHPETFSANRKMRIAHTHGIICKWSSIGIDERWPAPVFRRWASEMAFWYGGKIVFFDLGHGQGC